MGKFLVRAFAVIGVLATFVMIMSAMSTWYWFTRPAVPLKAPDTMVLTLDFTQPITEQSQTDPLSIPALLQEQPETPLLSLIEAIDAAKDDPRVKGIVARFGGEQPGFAHAQEIHAAIMRFRQSGKFTYAFAPNYGDFGQGNKTYFLASAFENIWVQPVGTVGLTGLAIQAPFGKTALANLGVSTDFLRREEYKSVMENVARDEFSPPVRANMEAMMNNLAEQQISGIAEGRKMEAAKVRELMARGPFTASEALKEGLVTRVGYEDEMLDAALSLGTDVVVGRATSVDVAAYLAYEPADNTAPKATIALIHGLGMITDTPHGGGAPLAEEHVINTEKLVAAFESASKDKSVQAILFRVDSPGGSPSASETIRRALIKAKESKKPVFVSMGSVAASGGYWISMNADRIVAEPSTLTGSIGVVAGKFVTNALWAKLGVKWDGMATNDNAQMWSMLEPFSAQGRDRVNAMLDETYQAFTSNVAASRKIPLEKMSDIAKGRVWTGDQAVKIGLVDELGGIVTTIQALKKELKLEPTDMVELQPFPPPETPTDLAIKMLRSFGIESAMVRSALGHWQKAQATLAPVLDGLEETGAVRAKLPAEVMRLTR